MVRRVLIGYLDMISHVIHNRQYEPHETASEKGIQISPGTAFWSAWMCTTKATVGRQHAAWTALTHLLNIDGITFGKRLSPSQLI